MDTSVVTTETTMKSGGQFEPAPQSLESAYPASQESALRVVANNLHRLNESIVKAVDVGLSVELMRACRYHNKTGCWGDQMVPIIERKSPAAPLRPGKKG